MKILSQMSFQKHSVNEQNPANQLMLTPIPVPYSSSLSGVWTLPNCFCRILFIDRDPRCEREELESQKDGWETFDKSDATELEQETL